MRKGDSLRATFVLKKAELVTVRCLGTVVSISVSMSKRLNNKSRIIPAAAVRTHHDATARFWVKQIQAV